MQRGQSRGTRGAQRVAAGVWLARAMLAAPTELARAKPPDAPPATPTPRKLRVATFEDPPFSTKDATGAWTGLAVELWHEVADELGVEYELTVLAAPEDLLPRLKDGSIDIVAAAVPVTLARVREIEFSSAFLSKGYSIATVPRGRTSWLQTLGSVLAERLRDVVIAIVVVFLLSSVGIWWIERKRNPEHFGGNWREGIGNGFWWTASTMTTVGYGDRTPVTNAGRAFAVLVMFLSIVLVSIFTGLIASRLTVVELRTRIRGIADLAHSRVGVARVSPMATFLNERGIAFSGFEDIDHAVATLVAGGLDAVVAGEAELHYLAHTQYPDQLAVLPGAIDQGFVAFALPAGSPIRREINAALVAVLESPEWRRLRHEYLHR